MRVNRPKHSRPVCSGVSASNLPSRFRNRSEAGRLLGERLAPLRSEQPIVLALPRGGVPVAVEVADALGAPLDILLVRKLGVPFHREFAFGAIGEDGARVLNNDLVKRLAMSSAQIADVEVRERAELLRRVQLYRAGRSPLALDGRTVVIVDDGLATGATARVAVDVARARGARRIVVAVPVAPPEAGADLATVANDVVSLLTPDQFRAVGDWYDEFNQTTDDEVTSLLRSATPEVAREVDEEKH